jgi:hypothetical protein
MVLPNESTSTTDGISDFLQVIRRSCNLSEREFEKVEAKIAEGDFWSRTGSSPNTRRAKSKRASQRR